jgi:sulfur relay (sulfurtransferase) complex TusBCD TusD component (DsrE family)
VNLAIMLASNRDAADEASVGGLARAALSRGHQVRLFLVGDGVHSLELAAVLAGEGVRASLCEADAAQRGIIKAGHTGVFFGSLYDWAKLAEDADRIVSFA